MQQDTDSINRQRPAGSLQGKVVVVTGAARRIGAITAGTLHTAGARVLVHYHSSGHEAEALVAGFNRLRADSAACLQADLRQDSAADTIVDKAICEWGQLDVLVNNASGFFPTPLGSINGDDIDTLFASNFRAPLLLAQAAAAHLRRTGGCIVNMIDIHAYRPYTGHTVYCAAKAALLSATRSLALELAPDIRVNGIAPGSILWPEGDSAADSDARAAILAGIPLQRNGTPGDIANAIEFLCSPAAAYITGQIISIDGGRSL